MPAVIMAITTPQLWIHLTLKRGQDGVADDVKDVPGRDDVWMHFSTLGAFPGPENTQCSW